MPEYLYLHIPFCLKKCLYCDFLSVPYDADLARDYVNALCRELKLRMHSLGSLKSVYIGGGTPTVLDAGCHEQLFGCLREVAGVSVDAEITVEANPATVSGEYFERLRSLGINRISLGVQSFQDRELKALGRLHTAEDALLAAGMAAGAGFRNLSLDLIYGIPRQTPDDWQDTLAKAAGLCPQHISAYELTPEEKTPLLSAIRSGRAAMPEEDVVIGMYHAAIDTLSASGFSHYEISNFALPGFSCRHNMNYWDRGEYTGAGAGAHSFAGGIRASNETDIGKYIRLVNEGVLPVREELRLTDADAIKEFIFLGLRKREGICLGRAAGAGADLAAISAELVTDGFLEEVNGCIRLTRKGLPVANAVIVRIFEQLGV